MAHIVFYTKPGCMTSARQIDLLQQAGHDVEVRDLLAHDWSREELVSYFGAMPAEEWFNPNSPRVKSGEIDPAAYDPDAALSVMRADHLLIRRPLMESGGSRLCGFDPVAVHNWIGLGETVYSRDASGDFTSCSHIHLESPSCP